MKTYGRTTILANYTEEQILKASKTPKKIDEIISEILTNSASIHENNKNETLYLKNYYYGIQDIQYKEKLTRPEINNKTCENHAFAIVDFKKTYLLGKPIQYVQLNNSDEKEISLLNKYVRYENKQAKDMLLYEDMLICGRGFRYTNKDIVGSEDEAPFELINCQAENTEVIYSSKLGNEQLMEVIYTDKMFLNTYINDEGIEVTEPKYYNEYTVYLRNMVITYNDKTGYILRSGKAVPLLWGEHIINEYYTNRKRIGLIEIGKDLLDDINYLESLDKDDMEQFVNAIMVFTNAEVSEEDLSEIKELGAVCINSTDQKKASVDLLQGRLNATDTQTYYNRLVTSLYQILGVPIASDSGGVVSGDTGKAKLTGQGFTSAGIRAEGDETMFRMCDYNSLKVILKICKSIAGTGILSLNASDIDSKFQRDMSDNLMVKTQALMNLYSCDIPREIANSIVNLFSDSHAVTDRQEELFGPQQSQQSNSSSDDTEKFVSDEDKALNQDKILNNAIENDNQGQ